MDYAITEKKPEIRLSTWQGAAIIFAAVLIVFSPVINAEFIWDDNAYLWENPAMHSPAGLGEIWFTFKQVDYFPLTQTSLWLEYQLFNKKFPTGYHIINLILHAASAVLWWRILKRLRAPGAFISALIFAVHPVTVASAAWITERKNTLSMLFFTISLLAWLIYDDERHSAAPNRVNYRCFYLALAACLAALLAKSSVVGLPIALLLLAWWRRGRISRDDVLGLIPFLLFAFLISVITLHVHNMNVIQDEDVRPENLASRIAVAGMAVWFYVGKALFPYNLRYVYPRWDVDPRHLSAFAPLLLLLAAAAICFLYRRTWGRSALMTLVYCVVMLFPALGFFDISYMRFSLAADQWQYVAVIAPVAFVVGAISWSLSRPQKPMIIFAVVIVALFGVISWKRCFLFDNKVILWRSMIIQDPFCWTAHYNYGVLLGNMDQKHASREEYNKCLAIETDYTMALNNRGSVKSDLGDAAGAIQDYTRGLEIELGRKKPENCVSLFYNRGLAYGRIKMNDKAIADYSDAVKINPGYANAYFGRGLVYISQQDYKNAINDFSKYIGLVPVDPQAYFYRATCLYYIGYYTEALRDAMRVRNMLEKALKSMRGKTFADDGLIKGLNSSNDKLIEELDRVMPHPTRD